jgi:hypothetical protein
MLNSIVIYNASYWLELNTAPYGVRAGAMGPPEQERIVARPWGRGYAPPAGTNYGNRQAQFTITLSGTGIDDWAVNSRQLREVLTQAQIYHDSQGHEGDPAYLAVQMDGATNTVEWDVLFGQVADDGLFQFHMAAGTTRRQIDVPLSLTLKPWGRPQAITRVTSGNLDNGADSYTLPAPAGDRETPLKITMQSASGDDFRRFMLARWTQSPVSVLAGVWALEATTGAHTGYTVTDIENSANFSLSNVGDNLRVTHTNTGTDTLAAVVKWTIDSGLESLRGRFRVYLVEPGTTSLYPTALGLTYGGTIATGGNGEILLPAVTSLISTGIAYLGEIEIPHRSGPATAVLSSFEFSLRMSFANSNGIFEISRMYLMPVGAEPFSDITLSAQTSATDQLINDNLSIVPALYVLDSSGNLQSEYPVSPTLDARFTAIPGKDNLFLPLMMENANGVLNLTDVFTLTFEYYPQYDLLF